MIYTLPWKPMSNRQASGDTEEVSPRMFICIPCSKPPHHLQPQNPAGLFMLIMRFSRNPRQSHSLQVETPENSLTQSSLWQDPVLTSAWRRSHADAVTRTYANTIAAIGPLRLVRSGISVVAGVGWGGITVELSLPAGGGVNVNRVTHPEGQLPALICLFRAEWFRF